jgi:hypothetical protein
LAARGGETTCDFMTASRLRPATATGPAQADGFVDPLLPAAAYWLQWMAERGLHQMARAESRSSQERLAKAYAGIMWNTLYAPTRRLSDRET